MAKSDGSSFVGGFVADVLKGTLGLLKPILSVIVAVGIVFVALNYGYHTASDMVLDSLCAIPLVRPYVQACQVHSVPDFSNFVKAQEMFYDRMIVQASGPEAISALELKRVELATRDLQIMVKYSNLMSADLLHDKLGEYLGRSRQFGKDVQSLQAQTKGVIDNLITYNTFTLRKLSDAESKKSSRQDLRVVYESAMALVEKEARRLIIAIETAQTSLMDLEQDLHTVHEISAQEKSYQRAERPHILGDIVSMVRGKGLRRPLVEENLQLLNDFDAERTKAAIQLMRMLNNMEAFQMDLEELRSQVVAPVVAPDIIPLEVHIENIGKAIERLKHGKVIAWKEHDRVEGAETV
ncbi:hypothetical protein BJV82DRAFT_637013 [Fennellomyces sp. T-0311]|nr:hypothetical protein BJV82DRAFT_637013 [Fennellomyces sp. T-0311]